MEFPALSLVRPSPRLGAVCSAQRMHALCEVGTLNLPLNCEPCHLRGLFLHMRAAVVTGGWMAAPHPTAESVSHMLR